MATFKKRSDFFVSEEGIDVRRRLQLMAGDSTYNTSATYNSNTLQYPDNRISFVDKHMNYLNTHPKVEADKYVANLRLMTRIR